MNFSEIIQQAVALLQRNGRVTYRVLQREFELDDGQLEDLKEDLLFSHPEIIDADVRGLVWTDGETAATQPAVITPSAKPKTITIADLPAGDRRQLTVMFCDLVGSTVLSR